MANRPKQSPKRTLPIVPGAPITSVRIGPYQILAYKRTLPSVPGSPVCIAPGVIAIPPAVDPYGGFTCPLCAVTESIPPVVYPGIISFVSESQSVRENTPGYARIYVQRLSGAYGSSSVYYSVSDGTATSPTYYTAVSGTLSWASGSAATQSFTVPIIDNAQWELHNRKFSASLSLPFNSALGLDKSIITILNDDPFTAGNASFEFDTGFATEIDGEIIIYVLREGGSDGIGGVSYTTNDGTAVAGVNYTTTTGSFTWAHGDASPRSFSVPLINSNTGGPDLSFTTDLQYFTGIGIGTYITDTITLELVNPASPGVIQFTSSSYSVAENAPGYVTLYVHRTGGVSGSADVNYTSSNGTAIQHVNYTGSYGTLSWANNDGLPKSFTIGIIDDGIWTPNLKFSSSLYNETGSTLGTISQSIVTIINSTSYAPGTMSFVSTSYSTYENTASLTLHVGRSGGSNGTASVDYSGINGTAMSSVNYKITAGTLSWADGESGVKTFTSTIYNIAGWNPDLIFTASLSTPVNAALGLNKSLVTILNVDPYSPGYILNDQDEIFYDEYPNTEQASASFSRYGGADGPASVLWGTVNGTAIQGVNYVANSGTVSWAHGQSGSQFVYIDLMNDGVWREALNPVSFKINQLAEPDGALPGYRISTDIHIENVNPPQRGTMSFVSPTYSVAENTPGYVRLYVTRSGGSDQTASVGYVVHPGTATYPADFTYTAGIFNWASGEHAIKSFDVPIINNAQWVAVNKYFTASLQSAFTAMIGTVSRSIVTIINDDLPVPGALSFTNESLYVSEGAGTITIYVIRVNGSDQVVSTTCSTIDGTATDGVNYVATSSILTWASGDVAAKPFVVQILNDGQWNDPNLYFNAQLTNPVNTTYELDATTIEIQDINPKMPGTMSFYSATYSIDEPNPSLTASLTFYVTRSGGTDGISSASCYTSNGSAEGGVDYMTTSSVFVWGHGNNTKKPFVVEVYRNTNKAYDTGFTASLNNEYNSLLGTVSQSIATIINSGDNGIIEFISSSYTAYESASAMTFHITRSYGTTGFVSALFTTIDGTAISGSDYTGSRSTISWNNGESDIKTIDIVLEGEDNVMDGNKVFTGSLSNVVNGILGTVSESYVTIIDTTAVVQFTDSLYVGEDGAIVQTLWYERLGYAGNDISMSVTGSEGLNTLTPSGQITRGITAEPGEWGGTQTISWASGSDALANHTISMTRTAQGSSLCTRSIELVSPFATLGNPSVAETLQLVDGGFPPINVTSFGWIGNLKPQYLDVAVLPYNSPITTSIRNFSAGLQHPTTVSFVTMDGTANAGIDYTYTNGTVPFLTTGAAGVDIFEGPSVEVYPSMAGKYFYLKLSSVEPGKTASIMYPSKLKINGTAYGGSMVSFVESASSQPGTNIAGAVPFDVTLDRSGNLTDPLTVKVHFGGPSANVDYVNSYSPINPDFTVDVSWGAGIGGPMTVLDLINFQVNTFLGAVTYTSLTPGYLSMSLEKSAPSDNVAFGPTASIDVTFERTIADNVLFTYPPDATIANPITPSITGTPTNRIIATNCTNMTTLDLSNNAFTTMSKFNVINASSLVILTLDDNRFTSFDMSGIPSLGAFYCRRNRLTSLTLGSPASLQTLHCEDNSLTSLNITNATSLLDLFCTNNLLTQTAVDNILATLVASGVNGGQVWLDGLGNATPSIAGLANKAILEGAPRGFWLVNVNT